MENLKPFQARSGSVLIEGDIAVISFLTAIDGYPNVCVSMDVGVLEQLRTRIARALDAQPKPLPPE